ncbi:MAG: hypothetical protein HC915_09085 [Anaerolineae bacterium]|nr:hypothetical protein [Anaerolineae bacterium]
MFLTALGVMAIPAPYLGGLLYDLVDPSATFMAAALLCWLAVPLAWLKLRRPSAQPTPPANPPELQPIAVGD